jgi:hypothetical protein
MLLDQARRMSLYAGDMTRGEEIIDAVRSALERLQALTFGAHARADIANVVDPLGSRVDSFLRAIVFPTSTRRDNFYDLIERLGTNRLASGDVQWLHDLRSRYNTSKHAPATPLVLAEAIAVCERTLAALRAAVQLGVGTVDVPFERELNYYLYVAFWDHYHTSDTEVAVMVPSDHWLHVSAVDVHHLDIRSWDKLKPLLLAHPRFRLGKEHFRPEVWKGFAEESGDFLNAGVWEGDYAELVSLLADFEDRGIAKALLPSSSRNHNAISVATALTIAAVDIARAATVLSPNQDAD